MEAQELTVVQPEVLAQLTRAERETAVDIAKKYPRSITNVKQEILELATCDEETAKACFYSKPIDNNGTLATGPSIRLAEIVVSSYQNILWGSTVIEESERWIKVRGHCIDLQKNIAFHAEVQRSIWSETYKKRYSQNLIQTTIKAASAIAVRDAVFKVISLGLFKSEIDKIKEKATGKGGPLPLEERVKRAFNFFLKRKVTENQIFELLKVRTKEEITEEHLETLVGLRTGIEDNEFTAEEAFKSYAKERQEAKAASVAEGVKNLRNKKEDKKEEPSQAPEGNVPDGDPSKIPAEDLAEEKGQGKLL